MAHRHTVHVGETLQSLAQEYYGDPALWQKIFKANSQRLKTPEVLTPGEQVVIPD